MPSGIETLVTALPLNADSPIVVTEYSVPLLVTVSGIETEPEWVLLFLSEYVTSTVLLPVIL